MRARFLERTGGNQSRRRGRGGSGRSGGKPIPIPSSFSSSLADDEDEDKKSRKKARVSEGEGGDGMQAEAEKRLILPDWNSSWLKHVETALSIKFLSRNQSRDSSRSLPLDEFYALLRNVSLEGERKNPIADLTKNEQVLLDLLCAGSPDLYALVPKEDPGGRRWRRWWVLELSPYKGNRLTKLQALMEHKIDASKRDSFVRDILDHRARRSTNAASHPDAAGGGEKNPRESGGGGFGGGGGGGGGASSDPLREAKIRDGMTLEERVRARADAKEDLVRRLAGKKRGDGTSSSPGDCGLKGEEKVSLLRLANALWSHSSHILLRQSQVYDSRPGGSGKPVAAKACALTFKDMVNNFSGALRGGGCPPSSRPSLATEEKTVDGDADSMRSDKKLMNDAILRLHDLAPQWIYFSVSEGPAKTTKLSKKTTVWIRPSQYHVIRSKLEPPRPTNDDDDDDDEDGDNKRHKDEGGPRPAMGRDGEATSAAPPTKRPLHLIVARPRQQSPKSLQSRFIPVSDVAAKPRLSSTSTPTSEEAVSAEPSRVEHSRVDDDDDDDDDYYTSPPKGQRIEDDDNSSETTEEDKKPSPSFKRVVSEPSRSETNFQFPKRQKTLRINYNLILLDADYTGGGIIQPSDESPRGLKRLFCQMNEGRRI